MMAPTIAPRTTISDFPRKYKQDNWLIQKWEMLKNFQVYGLEYLGSWKQCIE